MGNKSESNEQKINWKLLTETFIDSYFEDMDSLIANTAFRQDFAVSNMFKMTLAGNITVNNPTNQVAGQSGVIEIVNGGSYTVSWGTDWDFAAGTAPTITSSGTDVLSYYVTSANNITVTAVQAVA